MNEAAFQLLCPFQVRWLREPASVAIAEKSRRIGWTWTHALGVVLDRVEGRSNYYHSSADDTASIEFVDYCAEWARMLNAVAEVRDETEVIEDREIHTKVMTFASGRKIVAGSSNPTFLRSKGGAVGLDEFAFHRNGRELVKAAHATALFWGHPLRIWSTHNGEGSYFNGLLKSARQGDLKAAVHRVTIEDAVEQGIVERIVMRKRRLADVPAPDATARREWLDELRATCPDEDTWNEEYLCRPSSGQNALLSYELIQGCEAANLRLLSTADLEGECYAGFDVGRHRDLSALWVLQRVGDVYWTRVLRTFERVTFTAQEDAINLLMANRAVKRLCIDATGMGEMLAERATQRWGRYRAEGVKFSAPVKSELAMPLLRLFQDRLVRVPADPAVREDLHKVRKIVTAANNLRLDADRDGDGHADRFWALALAYHAADAIKLPLPPSRALKPVGW
jgi:phage FluMu gp28-like protein